MGFGQPFNTASALASTEPSFQYSPLPDTRMAMNPHNIGLSHGHERGYANGHGFHKTQAEAPMIHTTYSGNAPYQAREPKQEVKK